MIGSLKGKALFLRPGYLLLETANGVGFEINVPVASFTRLQENREDLFLYTALRIREENVTLFGFLERQELYLFGKIDSVNGVGPKIALACISALGAETLVKYINEGNVNGLKGIPGIGAKTAQRIILELTGKLANAEGDGVRGQLSEDLVSALVNLGYQVKSSREIVNEILQENPGLQDFAQLLRISLKRAFK